MGEGPVLRNAEGGERDQVIMMVEVLRACTLPFTTSGEANDTTMLMTACALYGGSLWGILQIVMPETCTVPDDEVAESFKHNFLDGIKAGQSRAMRIAQQIGADQTGMGNT